MPYIPQPVSWLALASFATPTDVNVAFNRLENLTGGLGIAAAVLVTIATVGSFFEDKQRFLKRTNRLLIMFSAILQLCLAVKIIQFNHANDAIQTAQLNTIISVSQRADLADNHAAEADRKAIAADQDAVKAHDDAANALASFARETNRELGYVQGAVGRISSFEIVVDYELPGTRTYLRKQYSPNDDPLANMPNSVGRLYSPVIICKNDRFLLTRSQATTGNRGVNDRRDLHEVTFSFVPLESDRLYGKDISYLVGCDEIRLPPSDLIEVYAAQNYQNLKKVSSVTMKILVNNADYLDVTKSLNKEDWERAINREIPLLFLKINKK